MTDSDYVLSRFKRRVPFAPFSMRLRRTWDAATTACLVALAFAGMLVAIVAVAVGS